MAHTANSVNYGQFTGNSAGGYPSLRAAGSDTNIGFDFATQGAAPFRFYTNAFGAEQLRVAHRLGGQLRGNHRLCYRRVDCVLRPRLDANISNYYGTRGRGTHQFFANGGLQMLIGAPASSVNHGSISSQPQPVR